MAPNETRPESQERTLLVTGASGFLGWNLCQVARRQGWRVVGTFHRTPVTLPEVLLGRIDLTDFRDMKEMLRQVRPDGVIHTAAIADANFCQSHWRESRRVNVEVPVNLAGLCADREIPFVFTSTDLVFDGEHAPYREEDPVGPLNVYGEHKALAEEEVLARYPLAGVCRLPLMFGRAGTRNASTLQWMLREMRAGRPLRLFQDEFRTPVSGETASQGLLLALERPVHGRLHLGGTERVSRYQFGLLVQEAFGLEQARIVPARQEEVPALAPRARDVSLDSSRAFQLGYQPPPLAQALQALASPPTNAPSPFQPQEEG